MTNAPLLWHARFKKKWNESRTGTNPHASDMVLRDNANIEFATRFFNKLDGWLTKRKTSRGNVYLEYEHNPGRKDWAKLVIRISPWLAAAMRSYHADDEVILTGNQTPEAVISEILEVWLNWFEGMGISSTNARYTYDRTLEKEMEKQIVKSFRG